ncbi:ketoacyl-ACP synthase III [Thermomicrobium sp. CFH 73360]|uniref:beta-ketoacyl-ACP synthase III n=1 Tax=Thermomicrobium sp. CFH 73360 TaxID=2951987 RepID=UPI002077924D|nr:beta-ketoacyl-ACP synthase III [Thermomicrobium sp. CFH 73360]MCM8746018.1 ketoacyl-ACP synthase III [Thermomicrobium sp. CFH 73360]
MVQRAAITGWGAYVPARVLTNADLERMVATSDEWIVTRTGIRERRIASPEETTLSMATEAARQAVATAGLDPAQLDLVIVATTTPDYLMPATASLLQAAIGASRAGAFDLVAACSGFVYALSVGAQFIMAGTARAVLVVGVDALTRWLDFTDRSTCVLFGDGAGAVVLEASTEDEGVLSTVLGSDGSGAMHLYLDGFPELLLANGSLPPKRPVMRMDGREVFRFSVRIIGEAAAEAVARAGLTLDEVDLLIPHQANLRIIDAAVKRLGLPWEKVWVNLDRYGNTSAASVPLGIAEAAKQGVLRPGMNVVLVAFGAGLAWAASVVRWGARGVQRGG